MLGSRLHCEPWMAGALALAALWAGCRREAPVPQAGPAQHFVLPREIQQTPPSAVVRGGFREWDVEGEPASLLVELTGVMPWHRTAQGGDRMTVLSGSVRVQVGEEDRLLHAGDALYAPAAVRRRFSRVEKEAAPVLLLQSEPTDRPRAVTWLEAGVEP